MIIGDSERLGRHVVEVIREGRVEELEALLARHDGLVTARIVEAPRTVAQVATQRTLLHVATDWPGHFPNRLATMRLLLDRGADVNAAIVGAHAETPLHWAASCDDVEAVDLLLDHGARIDAPGAVIADGTPLADAVAFGQWGAARRLVERGATANLWQAAALGLMARVQAVCEARPAPAGQDITVALWCACHGGQQSCAAYLLERGADPFWVGFDGLTPIGAAERSGADALVLWLRARGASADHAR